MEPNSFKEFKTIIGRSAGTMPMTSNLYQVNLSAPPIFRKGGSGIYDPVKEIEAERTIDYYANSITCLLYTSPSPRDISGSRMPSSA